MKKELHPVHDNVTCDVCGRTILKGERTEPYLAPGGHRHQVCELCSARADQAGWIRESAAGDAPSRIPRHEPRRPLLGRLLGRSSRREAPQEPAEHEEPMPEPLSEGNGVPAEPEPAPAITPVPRSRPRDPRHVRAVPTTGEVKVERALELFNGSEHQRTISGLVRTLGPPWASARPDLDQPSVVDVVVAWELSWYRFRVDLGDEGDPVALLDKGEELEQLDEDMRSWNTEVDEDGQLLSPAPAEEDR